MKFGTPIPHIGKKYIFVTVHVSIARIENEIKIRTRKKGLGKLTYNFEARKVTLFNYMQQRMDRATICCNVFFYF